MFLSKRSGKSGIALIVLAVVLLIFSARSWAADSVSPQIQKSKKLQLLVGKSIVLTSSRPIKRVSEPDPKLADAIAVSPYQLYITGKAPGLTSLILWKNKHDFEVYDLEVAYDVSRLKQKLHAI
ncbi:MAG: pilus assembly protein N-terminal domain-containing protein, partial [Desulfatiglandales bacterium]